ncbi:DUF222 domain-containing protein, partial [Sphaerimonospora thailandensis]|uniref:DUF222 domain-containing protein n=1 Tax=Sphaerimonospora thailandensis TaxID=795644 RepID=UPI00194F18BB
MSEIRESTLSLALTPAPDSPQQCLAQMEELAFARDRLEAAIAIRTQRVHAAGAAREHGHASTKTWLRSACGMSRRAANRLVALGTDLERLPEVRHRYAAGMLNEGIVSAICAATSGLGDEDAAKAEAILLELADAAGPDEIAKAGRYLRAVLDPDGEIADANADNAARFLLVRETGTGGLEGEFRLPREAAARLRTLLDSYAKPKAREDDRPLRVRNADAFIAFLEQQITTELLVLVNAESLPDDPAPAGGPAPSAPARDDDTVRDDDTADHGGAASKSPTRDDDDAEADADDDAGPEAPAPAREGVAADSAHGGGSASGAGEGEAAGGEAAGGEAAGGEAAGGEAAGGEAAGGEA